MPNKMLIDASHPEETRVVVTRGNRIEEFDFESQDKKQLKGNIYLARVTRVEPSLQAAFVEYGGNRHGFLAFSEIHPDYYQIPVADRQALLKAEADAAEADDEEDEEERGRGRRRRRSGKGRGRGKEAKDAAPAEEGHVEAEEGAAEGGAVMAEKHEAAVVAEAVAEDAAEENGGNGNGGEESEVESVGAEDALEEARDRRKPIRRNYKIQEVVKRRQILLVQVVKEERGNKGAALTTYLSLAGRYSVLMPNTARGGGISRKITNLADRKRLKDVVKELDVPEGMGVILRTAGESRTKAEIKRDYEYLMRLWENVRTLTLQSTAPALVYEEGSLIKRSVRDLYNKDIDEILVAGEDGYREAKDFMRMLMPSHAKVVQPYRDSIPIFARSGIEAQLDKMLQPQVTLKSGGYIIINQTEALVAIDVNSGRSTKEHSIEDTALQTNLEAAEEVARQLRLRDMAGLVVIDFIDMEENRNNRAVEKRLKDCLKNDRARIQVGRISHFGLLEMSRQRIRASVLESTMQVCPTCGGTGHVRSESSVALLVIRAIEEYLLKDSRHHITVRTPVPTALYVLNNKRRNLADFEARFGLTITIEADDSVGSQHYVIARGEVAEKPADMPEAPTIEPPPLDFDEPEDVSGEEEEPTEHSTVSDEGDGHDRKRRRRRRRRGGRERDRDAEQRPAQADESAYLEEASSDLGGPSTASAGLEGSVDAEAEAAVGSGFDEAGKRRRRGKRGGKRNRREADAEQDEAVYAAETAGEETSAQAAASDEVAEVPDETEPSLDRQPVSAAMSERTAEARIDEAVEMPEDEHEPGPDEEPEAEPATPGGSAGKSVPNSVHSAAEGAETGATEPAARRRGARRAKPSETPAEPVVSSTHADQASGGPPRKTGWWQRKSFF